MTYQAVSCSAMNSGNNGNHPTIFTIVLVLVAVFLDISTIYKHQNASFQNSCNFLLTYLLTYQYAFSA